MKILIIVVMAAVCAATREAVTPVQKVIELLTSMEARGKEEMQKEQVQFATYSQWCDDTISRKTAEVQEAAEHMEKLTADIGKANADAATAEKESESLRAESAQLSQDLASLQESRQLQVTDFQGLEKDLDDSIDALTRAISVLKAQNYDRKAKAELISVLHSSASARQAKKVVDAFLSTDFSIKEASLMKQTPDVYEFQSSGVIDMLDQLKEKFSHQLAEARKEEANSRHSFALSKQDKSTSIGQLNEAATRQDAIGSRNHQLAANNQSTFAETKKNHDEDSDYKSETEAACSQKSKDFETRQQMRTEELQAIATALDILSNQISGLASKHLPSLVAMSFAQLRSFRSSPLSIREDDLGRVAAFLRMKADAMDSPLMSELAVRASQDPFAKVRQMIQDLIVRLQEEANSEAGHKEWCDEQLGESTHTRETKTSLVERYSAEIDSHNATMEKMTTEISELQNKLLENKTGMTSMTVMRNDEKKENEATVQDAKFAQEALTAAIDALTIFYGKMGKSLIQQEPAFEGGAYQGMMGEKGGVIGMLEVIRTDFARLETETRAKESLAESEYTKFKAASESESAVAQTTLTHNTTKKQTAATNLQTTREYLTGSQKELATANKYYDELKVSCIEGGTSFEERVSKRKEEIESLQEALQILNGETIGL